MRVDSLHTMPNTDNFTLKSVLHNLFQHLKINLKIWFSKCWTQMRAFFFEKDISFVCGHALAIWWIIFFDQMRVSRLSNGLRKESLQMKMVQSSKFVYFPQFYFLTSLSYSDLELVIFTCFRNQLNLIGTPNRKAS